MAGDAHDAHGLVLILLGQGDRMLVLLVRLGFKAQKRWQLMLIMRTVCFDASRTGRLMLVLLVLLAFKAKKKWQLMLMIRPVWSDTSRTGRLMLVLLVLLAFNIAGKWQSDVHDAHGLV